MSTITVVDARMGRGKSSAAIRYMNQHKGEKRFLYITPYITETERICESCDFDTPSDEGGTVKSTQLKAYMKKGHNVSATHSLFYYMDEEALELVRNKHYSLIIDESIEVVSQLEMSSRDFTLITEQLTEESEDGTLKWKDNEYTGRFYDCKKMAETGALHRLDNALISVLDPNMLRAFDEVFMLTYMFDGQYQKAYLDYFGFDYRVVGVERDECGYYFSDKADAPPPLDYTELINILDNDKMNSVGVGRYALSKAWYQRRGYENNEIKALRRNMDNYFRCKSSGLSTSRLWTCFKEDFLKIVPKSGRYRNNFLHLNARATNEYKNTTDLAYMINRFANPNISKFFATRDITIDADKFALSEMLQWIWRSAIRDDKPINLYIPSSRMRQLLIDWINKTNKGEVY